MTELESTLAQLLRDISLHADERAHLRRAVLAAARHSHSIPADAAGQSVGRRPLTLWVLFARPALAAWGVFVLIGAGTSLAAERTLPGDALYPFKIAVNERLRDVFTLSAQSDLARENARTQRRLLEAERLAAAGRLTPERQKVAESVIATQLAVLNERVRQQSSHGDLLDAATTASVTEAQLRAHQMALGELGRSADAPSNPVRPLTERVAAVADDTAKTRTILEQRLRDEENTNPAIRQAAHDRLAEAERLTPSNASASAAPPPSAATPPASVHLPTAAMVEEGRADFSAGHYGEAITKANEALRDITERTTAAELHTVLGLPPVPPPLPGDFAACRNAGYKIVNSLPRTCTTPEGKIFTEKETPPASDGSGASAEPGTTGSMPTAPATLSPSPR